MKKTYIAPKSQMFNVSLEGMIATSPGQSSVSFDKNSKIESENDILSNRGGLWNENDWLKEE